MNRGRRFHSTADLFPWFRRSFLLHSDAGTNGASGGGSAAGSSASGTQIDPAAAPPVVGFEQFAQSMDRFTAELGSKFDALRGDVGQLPAALRPEPQPAAPPDYDAMTNSDLVNHMQSTLLSSIDKLITDKLAPVLDRVNNVQSDHFRSTVTAERDKLAETHKDFGDWKPEMIELAKSHPTLGLRQLYNLARVENPDKTKTLDAKYNPPAPPPPPKWGGLTPAFGASSADTPKLSREDASKLAYNEVAQRHPGVLAALESM